MKSLPPIYDKQLMLQSLKLFMSEVHKVAKDHGWWDKKGKKTDVECHMLMVTEIAEATEEIRNDKQSLYLEDDGKPCGEASELADVLLRIFDYATYKKLPLIEALVQKHEYNKKRPHRHGGKKL